MIDATHEDPTPRMYRSNLGLRPHSDITAMISLACWQQARSGGASVVVSGVTVHDEMRKRAPRLLEPLYRGYHHIGAFNLLDDIAKAPEHRVAFHLGHGEMMVINNYVVMHARTQFTNHPEPDRRRRLVRLWLDAPGFRDVPKEFKLFSANGVPPQSGRRATYDFRKLYADDPVATGGIPRIDA